MSTSYSGDDLKNISETKIREIDIEILKVLEQICNDMALVANGMQRVGILLKESMTDRYDIS